MNDVRKVFTSSGSWTCPAGVTLIRITLRPGAAGGCSGGQGGSNGGGLNPSGGGGAGGQAGGSAWLHSVVVPVVPGVVHTITVGAGGAGGVQTPSNLSPANNPQPGVSGSLSSVTAPGLTLVNTAISTSGTVNFVMTGVAASGAFGGAGGDAQSTGSGIHYNPPPPMTYIAFPTKGGNGAGASAAGVAGTATAPNTVTESRHGQLPIVTGTPGGPGVAGGLAGTGGGGGVGGSSVPTDLTTDYSNSGGAGGSGGSSSAVSVAASSGAAGTAGTGGRGGGGGGGGGGQSGNPSGGFRGAGGTGGAGSDGVVIIEYTR